MQKLNSLITIGYPDIYLISDNKIIEVKSEYTYKSAYSINIRKKQACLDLKISFEFWVYDSKGEKTIKWYNI